MKNVGLVFAGGGVKGSYEIGVWRALNELGFDIRYVVGTSIGSVNGALFAMGAYDIAEKMWSEISINNIVNIDVQSENLFDIKNVFAIINEFYKNNGIDTSPLRSLLEECIDEEKIRKSDINYGLVTYSLTDHKEVALFKEDIPEGQMVEYIMASACFPGFKSQKIDNRTFIDGAVNNNMPIDLLIEKGVKNIIAVDIGGIGVVKNTNTTGINVFTIKSGEGTLGTLDFNSENIKKRMKMGYYDCYKTFGRLMGERYYFNTNDYFIAKSKYSIEILQGLEYAAAAFNIDNMAVYKMDKFIDGILDGYAKASNNYEKLREELQNQNVFEMFGKVSQLNDALIIAWIVDQIINNKADLMKNKLIMNVLGNNFCAASAILYLISDER